MKQVISASRRTDLPLYFPRWVAEAIREGQVEVRQPYTGATRLVSLRPEDVHTVVLWSKDFSRLLNDVGALRQALTRYEQLFCHLTITGLGGSALEPGIRPWEQVMEQLPELMEFAGQTQRVTVRFDPILHWREDGVVKSNFSLAGPILDRCAHHGVRTVRISFATLYGKVLRRKGWDWHDPPQAERVRMGKELASTARALGLTLYSCSDRSLLEAGVMPSKCIDGELLGELHPLRLPAQTAKDKGQRPDCGCTPSVDIGSYTMRCPNGCRYCYANPIIPQHRARSTVA
jgi:hypothetical protein